LKIGCLLSVRQKATRLPGKSLLDLDGKSVTVRLLNRIGMAKKIDQVILSTSLHPDDEVLVEIADAESVATFRGSEDDKLRRYYDTAKFYDLDAVVIVDGDDPLVFPEFIDQVAECLNGSNEPDCVYISNLPVGAASTGLRTSALEKVLELKDETDTEVWGGYFIGSGKFTTEEINVVDPLFNHPEIRLTLDYDEDFELIQGIHQKLGYQFSSNELMSLLLEDRELREINTSAIEKYESHIQNSAPVTFKKDAS
tara:strand:+ start:227 stop:988 length:762 start_codon:yes stop_codon:yes gene_type:complete